MSPSLRRLRRRLTAWYVGVFTLVLLTLGLSLLGVLTRQVSDRLDRSLESAAAETIRAAEIRERERLLPADAVVDAFDELRIPSRMLFVFDANGSIVHPATAPDWVHGAVRRALERGDAWDRIEAADDRTYRVRARQFRLPEGGTFVAVAAADVIEVQEEYASLILVFGLAGVASILLAALGGAVLARRSTRPVERAFAQMRRFMADAAHELRTPLTVLHGRADVTLQRERTKQEYEAALGTIRDETGRMSAMIERLLQLSQAASRELPIRRESMFLDDALLEAGDEARAQAAERNVHVEIESLEEARLLGDAYLVRQMLRNVLDNAVRHSPEGGVVRASTLRHNGNAIVIIADDGPGIPAEALSHVFEPFFRSDPSRGRTGGAGLGLAIARSIADAHDATIDIRSGAGTGTTVTISFPSD